MEQPTCITETVALLRSERAPLASRIDAIDLAVEHLNQLYPATPATQRKPKRRLKHKSRPKVARVVRPPRTRAAAPNASDAAERRTTLLALITKSAVGLTVSELRAATAAMKDKDRGNALQQLKLHGTIRRAGNTWVKVAA